MIPLMASVGCVAGSIGVEVGVKRVLPLSYGSPLGGRCRGWDTLVGARGGGRPGACLGQVCLAGCADALTWHCAGKRDDMEGIGGAGGILEQAKRWRSYCPWTRSRIVIHMPERKCSPRAASQFLYTVPDLPGTKSNKRAVGCSSPRVGSTMSVGSRRPLRCLSRWCHTCSSPPSTRTPAKRAGPSTAACTHGLI